MRTEGDYNRGLAAPILWARVGWAAVWSPARPVWRWAGDGWRRWWMRPLLAGALGVAALWPLDGWLGVVMGGWRESLPGDIRRELGALQQFGQGGSIILTVLVVLSLDRAGARRLWDWGAALAVTAAVVYPMKTLVGRPRPGLGAGEGGGEGATGVFYAPDVVLGPLGVHPFGEPVGFRHAWEFWAGISADLWSMPSAHTAYAVVMAVFLGTAYPRVAWLVWLLAVLVGVARVIFGAHYPTDVVAGAAIGAAAGMVAVRGEFGQRLIGGRSARGPAPA